MKNVNDAKYELTECVSVFAAVHMFVLNVGHDRLR